MNDAELKPCPFCGGKDIRDKVVDEFLHKAESVLYDRILQNQSNLEFASGLSVAIKLLTEIAEGIKK